MDINDSVEDQTFNARKFTSIQKTYDYEKSTSVYKNEKAGQQDG